MCMFSRALALAITLMVAINLSVFAATNVDRVSKDTKIQSALSILEQTGSENIVNDLAKNRIQVRFYDLSMISFDYARHYAMRVDTQEGKQYILINSRFEDAPTEAIACLVAHESIHNLKTATFAEEVMATTVEAKTWLQVRNKVANYQTSTNPLVKRLEGNANRYLTSQNGIANAIAQNATYKKQFNL